MFNRIFCNSSKIWAHNSFISQPFLILLTYIIYRWNAHDTLHLTQMSGHAHADDFTSTAPGKSGACVKCKTVEELGKISGLCADCWEDDITGQEASTFQLLLAVSSLLTMIARTRSAERDRRQARQQQTSKREDGASSSCGNRN